MKKSYLLGFSIFVIVGVLWALFPRESQAIPYFARKYGTSCQTCHVQFAKLAPFGKAFRRNGFRFPEGNDISFLKQEQLELGAPAWKKLFPKAVWPGEMPGTIPIAIAVENAIVHKPAKGEHSSFEMMGGVIEILSAGTFGEWFSWYGDFGFDFDNNAGEGSGFGSGAFYGIVKPFDDPWLQIKFGRFDPTIVSWNSVRSLNGSIWSIDKSLHDMLRGDASGANVSDSTLDGMQGLALFGVKGNLMYEVGLVEGNGGVRDDSKDVYASLHYKFGGMQMDGVEVEEEGGGVTSSTESPWPWREKSVTVGGFLYNGNNKHEDSGSNSDFYKYGMDIDAIYNDVNFLGNVSYESHRNVFTNTAVAGGFENDDGDFLGFSNDEVNVLQFGAQVDYVLYPWLVPSVRYDYANVQGSHSLVKYQFVQNILLRANAKIKVVVEFKDYPTTIGETRLVGDMSTTGASQGIREGEIELEFEYVF